MMRLERLLEDPTRLEQLYDSDVSAMLRNAIRLPYLQQAYDDLDAVVLACCF